jgi:hypothetical protein
MAAPTIPNGEEQFFPIIYEGNGGGQRVGKFVPFTDQATVANSCIFDSASNVYLSRTPGSAGNRKTFTISFWVKRGRLGDQAGSSTYGQRIFHAADSSSAFFDIKFSGTGDTEGANRLHIREYSSSAEQIEYWTNRTFEDTSKWYHILLAMDTTQSTSGDRIKLYVDGDQITSWYRSNAPSLNFDTLVNATVSQQIGRFVGSTAGNLDAYLAEFNQVDGQALLPASFGLTDTSTGRWIPKTLSGITYGTNGFRLEFGDSSALGDDTSGNTNDFTATNLASTDQTTDSPTQNFATLNPNPDTGGTLSEGNLKLVTANTGYGVKLATLRPKSGKYYAEFTIGSGSDAIIGVQELATAPSSSSTSFPQGDGSFGWYEANGNVYTNGTTVATSGSTYTSGDVLAIALDLDNQEVKFYKNNTLDNTIGLTGKDIAMAVGDFANADDATITANFGQKSFTYTPPTGFSALQQDNLPTTAKGVSGLVWTKSRDETRSHALYDSSRGAENYLASNSTGDESSTPSGLHKFLKGGFQTGENATLNNSGQSYVSWNWVANGGTTATNNDGSITSTVQANQTAGFSIVQYTGTGSNATVGHGLSSAPEWILFKNLDNASEGWSTYHTSLTSAAYILTLNNSNAQASSATDFNSTAPTSTVFSVGTNARTNNSSQDIVAYCWHSVPGFSKFGKYTGNGSTDGPFVYTGFKPAWIMIKQTNSTGSWIISDNKRNIFNPIDKLLRGEGTNTESTFTSYDMLSNGFKQRNTDTGFNGSGSTYIYMAFAEHPFVGDGTSPVTAR